MTATVERVSPNPKRHLSEDDERRVRAAVEGHENSYDELRAAVIQAANHGASVRVLAEFTGMSTNTISRWKAESKS